MLAPEPPLARITPSLCTAFWHWWSLTAVAEVLTEPLELPRGWGLAPPVSQYPPSKYVSFVFTLYLITSLFYAAVPLITVCFLTGAVDISSLELGYFSKEGLSNFSNYPELSKNAEPYSDGFYYWAVV